MTWPAALMSGPPLLPGFTAASVWIYGTRWPSPTALVRSTALIIPAVTVLFRPKGLPMAIAHSPGFKSSELPRDATGRFSATTFTTATSVRGSPPSTLPLKLRPSGRVTATWSAPRTTCSLVKINPLLRVMKPEPCPCCRWVEGPIPKIPPNGLLTFLTTSMRTTAGPTLSTAFTITFSRAWSGALRGWSLTTGGAN